MQIFASMDDRQMATLAIIHKPCDGKRVLYTALAESVPLGEYREIEYARHTTIHTDLPDAVVRAIRDLVDRFRDDAGFYTANMPSFLP